MTNIHIFTDNHRNTSILTNQHPRHCVIVFYYKDTSSNRLCAFIQSQINTTVSFQHAHKKKNVVYIIKLFQLNINQNRIMYILIPFTCGNMFIFIFCNLKLILP